MSIVVDRRTMLAAGMLSGLAGPAIAAAPPRVDAARLRGSLETLSQFGRPAGGGFADGVSRIAYSDADLAARAWVIEQLRALGLSPRIDAGGNILARRAGRAPGLKPIVIGSHIDTVRGGGNFDGCVGSMGALEVLRTLANKGITTRHPIDYAIWSNEEGATIGSGVVSGTFTAAQLHHGSYGVSHRDGIKRLGGDPDALAAARWAPGSIAAYLELHIEQGGSLDRAGVPIGVVDGIVAIHHDQVTITGFANHAGTTPMAERHNALIAAARLVEAVDEEVKRVPGRQVGTVGELAVTPNAPNVIPGKVVLTVELRDLDPAKLETIGAAIRARAAMIAAATGTTIAFDPRERLAPALATPAVQARIEAAATALGLKSTHLPSGAGHDAQNLATVGPMGMVFVPSLAGVSHSPKELSRWADIANGADVLLGTLLALDRA